MHFITCINLVLQVKQVPNVARILMVTTHGPPSIYLVLALQGNA